VGRRVSLGFPVVVGAALEALDPDDRLADLLPGGPLGRLAWRRAQRAVGVGDPVAAAVVLDGGGLPPGPPPPGRLGNRPERLAQVGGRFVLGGQPLGAALPGQLPDHLAVGRAEVGVGLQPADPAPLLATQGQLGVVGPVGPSLGCSTTART
jgi:hypothetical protein